MCNCSSPCGCDTLQLPLGPAGLPGPPGETPNIVFTVETLPPGSDATITQGGTPQDPTIQIGVPVGDPGSQGLPGLPGANGINSFSLLSLPYTQPPVGGLVTATFADASWPVVGQELFVRKGGYYTVISITGDDVQLQNDGYPNNAAPGTVIIAGSKVGPAGVIGPQGEHGLPGNVGPAGMDGHGPVVSSGTSIPMTSMGIDNDVYIQQVNSGKVVLYTKSSGVWVNSGNILGNRFFSFTTDPNLSVVPYNMNDYGVWYVSGEARFVQYLGTWNTLFTWSLTGISGPPWAFYATKTLVQPLTETPLAWTKINFEDSSTRPNFNNGSWGLNTYTFAGAEASKKFVSYNIKIAHSAPSSIVYQVAIVMNKNTTAPLAFAEVTVAAGSNAVVPILETTSGSYSAGDDVSLMVMAKSASTAPKVDVGCTFYITD